MILPSCRSPSVGSLSSERIARFVEKRGGVGGCVGGLDEKGTEEMAGES